MNGYLLVEHFYSSSNPVLTCYDSAGERVELGGRNFAKWASKVGNFVTDLTGAGPDITVGLDLPLGWRALTWAVGTWAVGSQLEILGDGGYPPFASQLNEAVSMAEVHAPIPSRWQDGAGIDLLATTRPGAPWQADLVAAAPLGSFALSWPFELPEGIEDGGSGVHGSGDFLPGPCHPPTSDLAWGELSYGDLATLGDQETASGTQIPDHLPKGRYLFTATNLEQALHRCWPLWRAGSSIVLCAANLSPATRAAILRQECAQEIDF